MNEIEIKFFKSKSRSKFELNKAKMLSCNFPLIRRHQQKTSNNGQNMEIIVENEKINRQATRRAFFYMFSPGILKNENLIQ